MIPFQSKLQTLASDESGAFESRDAESSRLAEAIERRFPGGDETTTTVLYARDNPFSPQDAERVAQDAATLCQRDVVRVITAVQLACGELPKLTPTPS
jgi:RND superfamily putative drug exporter